MRKILSVILTLCVASSILYAADGVFHFIHYDKSGSGLPYDGVRQLIQDSRGYIWAGTYKGLARFDGVRWKTFDRRDFGTNNDYISSLKEDGNGNIWIGTDEGVVIYRVKDDNFVHISAPGTPNNRTYCIECASDGKIYLGVRGEGLYCYDSVSSSFSRICTNVGGDVYRIASSMDGRLFVATYCGDLYEYEPASPDKGPHLLCGDYFSTDNIEGLACDRESLYVASKRHGLCRIGIYDKEIKVLCTIPDDARPVNVGVSGGSVWFSTTNGIRRVDPATDKVSVIRMEEGNDFGLTDNYVTCAVCDSSKGLWVSTDEGGICYSSSQMDRFIRFICPGVVKGFAQDKSSRVWVATERNGLFFFNPVESRLKKFVNNELPNDINALCSEGNNLWLGSHGGLYCMDTGSGKIRVYNNILGTDPNLDNRVVSIFMSREHNLYVGTNIGVSLYNAGTGNFDKLSCLQGITVENMAQDLSGKIWMATYSQGVLVYDSEKNEISEWYNVRNGNSSIPEMTSSICIDRSGTVWVVGFSSGFFCRKGADFFQYSRASLPTLPTDVYFTAVTDSESRMWLSSDNGLVCFSPSDCGIKVYSVTDGLLSEKFRKGGIALRDGRILMGGEKGFVMFDPGNFITEEKISKVAIVSVSIDGKQPSQHNFRGNPDMVSEIVLAPRQRNISFNFAAPGLFCNSSGTILCRLEGIDREWKDISVSRRADYYNIPKGKYVLRLAVPLADGKLNYVHREVEIEALPKFYESALGITVILLSVLVAVSLVFLMVYKKGLSRQSQKHKAKEQALREDLYHEKMSFFANVIHEIKTPLTLVRTPLQHLMLNETLSSDSREDVTLISDNTDYLEKLVKELLEFISLEEHGYVLEMRNIDLGERLGFICSNYIETAKSHNRRLDLSRAKSELVTAVDTRAFNKMVNNLLSNAVKYSESYIEVETKLQEGIISILFRNDGLPIPAERREKIFKPFVHYGTEAQGDNSFGIGLSYARKLARMHKGDIVLSDREDCTEFILSLPVHLVAETETSDSDAETGLSADTAASQPLLLIVEDNADLLGYLKRKLSPDYIVIGVNSAEKALEKLHTNKVDLILTDLGLKSLSGVELCVKLSSNPSLAHIPIIVLSAISTLETKIKCMENGASMYIEKPFSLDYLSSCIKSVLEKKKSIKSAFQPGLSALEMVQAELPDRDDDFIRRLDTLIADNISDTTFSNRQIETSLGISRSSLNRKFKALLGTTPNEYIRRKRLEVAAGTLRRGGVRISEICYAVGFNSPSYFAKCFKEVYGVLPAEYAKMEK